MLSKRGWREVEKWVGAWKKVGWWWTVVERKVVALLGGGGVYCPGVPA